MLVFFEASDTFLLVLTNAALGAAVLAGVGFAIFAVVKQHGNRRRRFSRAVHEVEAEARAMFRSGRRP